MDVREKPSNEKRLIYYDEIRSLFSAQYKETVRLIHNGETHLDNLAEGFTEADRIIRNIPSVDAVEVVRCRDCKHWGQDVCSFSGDDESFCTNPDGLGNYAHPEDFCSYGERKEGAN